MRLGALNGWREASLRSRFSYILRQAPLGIRPPYPVDHDMILWLVWYMSGFLCSANVLVGVVCLYFVGCLCVCFLSHGWGVFLL